MSYIKADEVLPQNIIKIIQQYIDGENIYIPKKDGSRVSWGEKTSTKIELYHRNSLIYQDYLNGETVAALASRYYLSDKTIQRIIREMSLCKAGSFFFIIVYEVVTQHIVCYYYDKKSERIFTMKQYQYIILRERPELKNTAARWFHEKWGVPKEAYLECMDNYLDGNTEYGWYLCLDGDKIIGGMGVIENDFHERKDLSPNVCAVYTDEAYRKQGIAGKLLNMAVEDMRSKGITPIYLVTDHIGFYEQYGWEFLCMVQGCDPEPTRMYVHY